LHSVSIDECLPTPLEGEDKREEKKMKACFQSVPTSDLPSLKGEDKRERELLFVRLAKGLVGTSVAESEGFEPSREI
jgi:hypothetical protein